MQMPVSESDAREEPLPAPPNKGIRRSGHRQEKGLCAHAWCTANARGLLGWPWARGLLPGRRLHSAPPPITQEPIPQNSIHTISPVPDVLRVLNVGGSDVNFIK